MRIRFNAAAIFAQNSLRNHVSSVQSTMKKLSTGLRINTASDDAAGLSISEKLRTQIRGSQMAIRNVQNANSIFQILEGVLASMQDNLQRMRELSLQASNGTLTDTDRIYIDLEVASLVEELDRLAAQKSYLDSFQMDGSFAPYKRLTNTANEAIATAGSVTLIAASQDIDLFGVDIIVEILQVAESQELDDVSQTSTHIQETFLGGGPQSILPSISSVAGTATGTRGDLLVNATATANNSVDSFVTLIRSHDGGDATPNYTIVGGSAPGGSAFQLLISAADTTGSLYVAIGEVITTDGAGLSTIIGDTDVDDMTRVQVDEYAEQFLADADGAVTLAIVATSMDVVKTRNFSDKFVSRL